MDATKQERADLAEADQHIEGAKDHIARQKERIEALRQSGHEIDLAESLFDAMQKSLEAFEHHREMILNRLKTGRRGEA